MFPITPSTQKYEQTQEQVAQPIQVPIILISGTYVIIQQDVRKIIDTRYITVKKLTKDGQYEDAPELCRNSDNAIFDLINLAKNMQTFNVNYQNNGLICQPLDRFNLQNLTPSLQEQIFLQSAGQNQLLSQFKLNKSTSTSELKSILNYQSKNECNCHCCSCHLVNSGKTLIKCKGVNTDNNDEDEDMEKSAHENINQWKETNLNLYV